MFIVIREFRGPITNGGPLTNFAEGKIITAAEYDVTALQAAGVRMVLTTPALLALLENNDRRPGFVLNAMTELMWGDVFP